MSHEFQSQEEVEEAIRGDYGAELQQEAEALVAQYQSEQALNNADQVNDRFVAETERLEKRIGRELTVGELRRMYSELPADGDVPNLVEAHAEGLTRRTDDGAGYRELTAEIAQDAMNEANAGQPEELPTW